MRKLAWLFALAGLAMIPALALASTDPKEVWVTNCYSSQHRPKLIVISCGDASNYVAKLRWSSWTLTRASGTGRDEVNSCQPNCASGHEKAIAAKVMLSDPRRCHGRLHRDFNRMKLSFVGEHGPDSTQNVILGCPLKR
jgi:hypothetical protein